MKIDEEYWNERIMELEDAMWELHSNMDNIEVYVKNREYVDHLEHLLLSDIKNLEKSLNWFERGSGV